MLRVPQGRAAQPRACRVLSADHRPQTLSDAVATVDADDRGSGRIFKINPLAEFSLEDLNAYIETHRLPRHPLSEDGYPSIGCMPCTRRVKEGEGYRDGRWSGFDKDECGIHTNVGGDGI